MKLLHAFGLFVLVLFSCVSTSVGQTYDLQFVIVQNNGTNLDAKVQVRAGGTSFGMGDANLVFHYPTTVLSNPTLLTAHNFTSGLYAPISLTKTSDRASVNVVFDGGLGLGAAVSSSYIDVATVRFTVVNPSASFALDWRTSGSGPTVVFNDNFAMMSQGTLSGLSSIIGPRVTTHPTNQTVPVPLTATFSVAATGGGSLLYQWQKNSVDIPGANSSSYTTPATSSADSGAIFRCVVSNAAASATSNGAMLNALTNYSGIFSDDFSQPTIDPRWSLVNPRNDATVSITGVGTANARLSFSIPGGVVHDLWTNVNTAPRLLQPMSNADFDVTMKFESAMSAGTQLIGLIVQQDSLNLVRFDFIKSASSFRIFAASIINNVATQRYSVTITQTNPIYLRVMRGKSVWSSWYSSNGTTWTAAPVFSHTMVAQRIGPYVGNAGTTPPAFTGLVDYFFNALSPISPEDPPPATPPSITSHPSAQSVPIGQTAIFTVSATGPAPLSYQWQKNNVDIGGATLASYTTPATAPADSGATFRCRVTNASGNVTSNSAVLNVGIAPGISSHPTNQSATGGGTATFSVVATGSVPLAYQWQKNNVDIGGATSSSYITPAVTAGDSGAAFRCRVTNAYGTVTSNAGILSVVAAPSILTHPANQTVVVGNTASFSVTASGTAPLSYQWQKNGIDISGATSAVYMTPATTMGDSGSVFRCKVTNAVGADTSNQAVLTVTSNTDPSGILSDNFNAPSLNTSLWTYVNPLSDVTLSMTGSAVSFGIAAGTAHDAWTGGNFAPRIIQNANNTDFEVEAKFTSVLNAQYQGQGILVQQDVANYVRFDFTRSSTATRIFSATITNNTATTKSNITITAGNPLYIRVKRVGNTWTSYYSYNGTTWTTAANYSHTLTVSKVGLFFVNAGTPTPPAFTGVADYFFNTAAPNVVAAPSISTHPANQTVAVGNTAGFSVTASGTAPLSYQWQKNGSDISGATSATYVTPATTMGDSGSTYRCRVTNAYGNATSNDAILNVVIPPSISTHPASQTVVVGASALFSVSASGSSLLYQWQKNGVPIAGATDSTYTTPATTIGDNGASYRCLVSNGGGNVLSNPAILSVQAPPNITTHPSNQTVPTGSTATFSIVATGSATLVYQWQKDGSDISGATSATYVTPATTIGDSGSVFRCRVTNAVGADTSNEAVLTVTSGTDASGILSDNFNAPSLNTSLWTYVNPLNDVTLSMTGSAVSFGIAAGTAHDAWTGGNFAPRILQNANNTNFEVEAKFTSVMNAQYQTQGILIQQDSANYVRFDFVRNSTSTRIFSATITNNTATTKSNITITAGNPLYLRVKRVGNTWTSYYSYNGTSWTTAANYSHTLTVSKVGLFFVNAGTPTPPAFTGVADYFFNTGFPIVPTKAHGVPVPQEVPTSYTLDANYPNPFNPTTSIQFALPEDAHVSLKIYNALGQEIRTLVDELRSAGFSMVEWDGRNNNGEPAASGVYLYRIEANTIGNPDRSFTRLRRMVLLK